MRAVANRRLFGTSATVSLIAAPALVVVVKEHLTHKPLGGALVSVNSNQGTTDNTGTVVFTQLASGTYTITVSASGHLTASQPVTITNAGQVANVYLIPILPLVVGGVTVIGALMVIGAKLAHWW